MKSFYVFFFSLFLGQGLYHRERKRVSKKKKKIPIFLGRPIIHWQKENTKLDRIAIFKFLKNDLEKELPSDIFDTKI